MTQKQKRLAGRPHKFTGGAAVKRGYRLAPDIDAALHDPALLPKCANPSEKINALIRRGLPRGYKLTNASAP